MNITRRKNCLIVALSGEIDHHSSLEIREAVDNEFEDPELKNMIFDFKDVEFMDSSGIGLVIGRYKRVSMIGGALLLTGVTGTIDRIMYVSGVYKLVRNFNTIDDALLFLRV